MPYFNQLRSLIDQISDWADLRHEQGANVAPMVKQLEKTLTEAKRVLMYTPPAQRVLKTEPNDLDAIRAQRPAGPRKFWKTFPAKQLPERMRGAWLGRAAGCTLGVPVENWSIADMEALAKRNKMAFPPKDYWTGHPFPDRIQYGASVMKDYLKGAIKEIPVDDDLTYTVLGLLILEQYGLNFTTKDVGEAWLKWLPIACTAEAVALDNLRDKVPAARVGERNNPFQEWIGADIRSDPWGFAAPGWPEKAAEFAYRDAYLSHRYSGLYGAMYFSAAIAAAFALDDPIEALHVGLTEIPAKCRFAKDVQWALDVAPTLKDWRAGRAAVDDRFKGMHCVHTNNNACLTIFGLHLGRMDFTKTIGITIALGLDNDCTGATAGSILGAVLGIDAIPPHWWKPFKNDARTYINGHARLKNNDIVQRFCRMAARVWAE